MKEWIHLYFFFAFYGLASAFTNIYPKLRSFPIKDGQDVGNPLFLTPYIENGKIDIARKMAMVQHKDMINVTSYAGYLTVNKAYNSNIFFWFFPAQYNSQMAPLVLWLQGGPGSSSLLGLFTENGPFMISENQMNLKSRTYSWHMNHNIIYVDNPVGAGFSFTESDYGYARNSTEVARNLLTVMLQFFDLFPHFKYSDFYVTGESYAGKFIPTLCHAIKVHNIKGINRINLKGLAIGNGLIDPINQLNYGDYLYQIGLIDFNGRTQFQQLENRAKDLIIQKNYYKAYEILHKIIFNGEQTDKSLFRNLTGFHYHYNFLNAKAVNNSNMYVEWIEKPDVRKAIHVGKYTFDKKSETVQIKLVNDIAQSVAHLIPDLLRNYKVLIYNGQLDIIAAYPFTENLLRNLDWSGAGEFTKAVRKQWWIGDEVVGYSKSFANLTQILVRNAGHMVPRDQSMVAWKMITRFTHNDSF